MSRDEVMAAALDLSREDRAALAERLLASLDDAEEMDPEEWDRLWADEAARRLEEIRTGKVETVPGEVVRERLEALLKNSKRAS